MQEKYRHKWFAFVGIALLSFGCYLDYTIVNIALPTIQLELHTNLLQLQWVMNIYFLALCTLATIMGRCGDLYGRRRTFYLGVNIFAIASLIAGLSPNITWLIFGRLLQGIGAAIVFPIGPSLLPAVFPAKEHGKAIAWLGSLGGIALALGPMLGGMIVAYWGWRWIFFINIPLALLGYVFSYKSVIEPVIKQTNRELDWPGMLLLALTIGSIIMGLIQNQNSGWLNPTTLTYFTVGTIAGITLIKIEHRKTAPLIYFKDFTNLMFYSGAILCFLAGSLSATALFFDPLYLQVIRQQSPELSGLILFAIPIAVFIVAFIIGWLVYTLGIINTIICGLVLAIFASLLQLFFTPTTPLFYILISFIVLGSMWALGNTVPLIAAQNAVEPNRSSTATGTMVTMFNIGGSLGLAIAVVIYDFYGTKNLKQIVQSHPNLLSLDQFLKLETLIANPAQALQNSLSAPVQTFFNNAFMQGFSAIMWALLSLSSLILLSVVLFKLRSRRAK